MQAGRLPLWRNAIDHPQPLARALCIVVAAILVGLELWPAVSAQIGVQMESPGASPSRTTVTPSDIVNTEQITSAELFGHSASQNGNLPQTTLPVTLRAVFAASDSKTASAVIESNDGRTQIIKVGGTVDASTTLQAVNANSVVLLRNGELETLYFPVPQESSSNSIAGIQTPALPEAMTSAENSLPAGASAEEIKRAAIMQRLEELRARTPR